MNYIKALLIVIMLVSQYRTTPASNAVSIIAYPYMYNHGVGPSLASEFTVLMKENLLNTVGKNITITISSNSSLITDTSSYIEIRKLVQTEKTGTTTHLLAGTIAPLPEGISISTSIISVKSRKVEYRTYVHAGSKTDFPDASRITAGRIALYFRGSNPAPVEGLTASTVEENGKIALSWNSSPGKSYAIYRSPFQEGALRLIGQVSSSGEFSDTTALRGLEYRYGIGEVSGDVPAEPAFNVASHLKAPLPTGLNMTDMQKLKSVTDAQLRKERKKNTIKRHISFLEKYYMHPVKLSLAMLLSKSYLDNGTLVALSGFTGYSIDSNERRISLTRDSDDYRVELKNNSFFNLIDTAEKAGIPDLESLKKKLLLNSIAYCLYRGEKRIVSDNGYILHVPCYEAFGISTEYFRNYAKWKSSTLMFGTSDGELKKKIREVREKTTE